MPRKIGYFKPAGQPDAKALYEKMPSRVADRAFFNSARWRKLRAAFLAENPVCARCPPGSPELAQNVHHKKPRKQFPDLAFDWENLEGLCIGCHNREEKTRQ